MLDKTLHLYHTENFDFPEMVIFEMVFHLLKLLILTRDVKY